ncbi:hypothetical protein E8E13_006531 [Curvularia kusanoi]|uniref:Uncharacterized protein n=1 Tax=Curvularia kusanoi TaxID=90978 RepID=A0A9P4TAH3_CURKU|nr:hypothetical protein E8E13_006531 [Curvularia kusanoi]
MSRRVPSPRPTSPRGSVQLREHGWYPEGHYALPHEISESSVSESESDHDEFAFHNKKSGQKPKPKPKPDMRNSTTHNVPCGDSEAPGDAPGTTSAIPIDVFVDLTAYAANILGKPSTGGLGNGTVCHLTWGARSLYIGDHVSNIVHKVKKANKKDKLPATDPEHLGRWVHVLKELHGDYDGVNDAVVTRLAFLGATVPSARREIAR